jgi:hypothetical protein
MIIYLILLLPANLSDLPIEQRRAAAFLRSFLVLLQMGFTQLANYFSHW